MWNPHGSKNAVIWREEKVASLEALFLSKKEALSFLAMERQRIMSLSREQAINEVLKSNKIQNRIRKIESIKDSKLLNWY